MIIFVGGCSRMDDELAESNRHFNSAYGLVKIVL